MFGGAKGINRDLGRFIIRPVIGVYAEAGKVVLAHKQRRGFIHGRDIQIARKVVRAVGQQRAGRAALHQRVAIKFADSIKARMKTRIDLAHTTTFAIVGQARVERHHDGFSIKASVHVNMGRHGKRVHATIGAARGLHGNVMAHQVAHSFFNRSLNTARNALPLPAKESRAMEFEEE